jgi:putative transposase
MPRFRRKDQALPTLNYTLRGFSIKDGRLCLAGGAQVVVVWSRPLASAPSSVRVYRDATGKWWASFVVKLAAEPLPRTSKAIGIDWGVTETATTTDPDFDLPHAQHSQRAASHLAHYQRQMARRRPKPGHKASAGYRKARARAAKTYHQVAGRRRDDARKWAKNVVRNFDQIAVEDFRPKFLASSTMARKAADAAIATAKAELAYMAAKHCRELKLVDPAYTTMDCGDCGARAKHHLLLSERTYTCESCGSTRPRDRNSAAVMVARAGFNPAGADRVRLDRPLGAQAA